MQVILLEKVLNLGSIGDTVKVKSGYARNFLFPQGKAISATKENLAKFEKMRTDLEHKAADDLKQAEARAEKLAQLAIVIPMQASEEGKLYGSVTPREIVAAIEQAGEKIVKKEIILLEGPIHETGEFEIRLQLHSDVVIPCKIKVVTEK